MSVDSSLSREDAKAQLGILYENGDGGFEADIGMAIKLYTEAFEAGSGEGAVCLGVCYANGNGVERSMEEARRYFKISAERENGRGMDHHGRMLEADGKGEEALSFYLRAAEEKQNYEAYVSAGCLLDSGESGIEKDVERAYEYFVKAEQMTTVLRVKAKAQRYIAYAYRDGDGVEKDLNEAVRWFEKAIENNDGPGSEMALGTCYKEMGNPKMALECFESANKNGFGRAGVAAALMLENADGVPQDKERAAINYKRAVLTGEPVAFVYLGQAYEAGSGVPQNGSMALALYERGAALGNPEGSLLAGLTYCRGECDLPKQNHPKANMYFGKCMEQGFGSGTACLARAVRDGHGCERDGAKAIQLFEKSFDQNYPQGAAEAGVVYENGAPGVPADIDKANACYKRAAEAGSGLGALYYGLNLEGGKGMEANNEEACKYYRMGVEAGNPKAMTCLGVMLLHGNGCEQNEEEAASMFASGAAGGDPRGNDFFAC